MRLAIVTHNVIRGDGQSRVALEVARHALSKGHQVSLLADQVDPEIVELGATWIPIIPRLRQPHLLKVWDFAQHANDILAKRKGEFDIVQAFGFVLNCSHQANNSQFVHDAWLASPVHTARLRRDLYGAYQWAYTRLNVRWERKVYQKAHTVIASSELIRQQLINAGVQAGHIQTILNGVDLDEFHPGNGDRLALGLPPSVPLALFAGDIRTPRKNLDTVLKALKHTPNAHLIVVGATERSPYPAMASELGLMGRVHFLGFRRDVAAIMRNVDFFVFPSRYEACSLVILEALASGLPVITAQTAGGAEIVNPDCGIVLSDPDDEKSLIASMNLLVKDASTRMRMGQAARRLAEGHSWTRMAEAYLKSYLPYVCSAGNA